MLYGAVLNFQCTTKTGWKLREGRKTVSLTERAKLFLPVLLEFLKSRPPVNESVGIVQQVRLFKDGTKRKIGTLLSLQQLPKDVCPRGVNKPRLLAPALYVEADWTGDRKSEEKHALLILLGLRKESQILNDTLENKSWCYDLVLRLEGLDEELARGNDAGGVRATIEAVKTDDSRLISDYPLWEPDNEDTPDAPLTACFCLPWLPPTSRLLDDDSCVVYMVGRRNSRETLEKVCRLWQRQTAHNVLLAAEPGSGKEVVARLIHYGRGRGQLISTSAGGQTWETLGVLLFGQGQAAGPPLFRGLIEEALNGALFVDEIDKAHASVRSGLLRVIEAGEFHRPGSGEQIKLPPEKRPLFVFAGSGQGGEAKKIKAKKRKKLSTLNLIELEPPDDFWQRIDAKITFSHPFGPKDAWERKILKKYLCLFMRRSKDKVNESCHSPYAADKLLNMASQAVKSQVEKHWTNAVNALYSAICSDNGKRRPSLRSVRSASEDFVDQIFRRAQVGTLPNRFADFLVLANKTLERVKGA